MSKEVNWEKRYKDTLKSYTQGQQKLKKLEAQNKVLSEMVATKLPKINISGEEQERLDSLKYSNPDEWRKQINDLEEKAKASFEQEVQEQTKLATEQEILEEFLKNNPELTQAKLDREVPAGLKTDLDSGKIDLEEFLNKAKDIISTEKKPANQVPPSMPSLNAVNGGQSPSDEAQNAQKAVDYKNLQL